MLCEEDHVRVQVIYPGLSLEDAYRKADELDEALSSKLAIAFDPRLGYLTQCPTNLGTGLRASVMLHLPALSHAGLMPRLSSTIAKLGLTLRGTFGEGSKIVGELYQLSNQVTLGISEQAAIQNLAAIARQIMEQETAARETLRTDNVFIDRIYRRPFPNRFLASLASFAASHKENQYMQEVIRSCFRAYFEQMSYFGEHASLPLHVVGGLVSSFEAEIGEAAAGSGVRLGVMVQSPIEGLVSFHKE
jgi:hypothetical protein